MSVRLLVGGLPALLLALTPLLSGCESTQAKSARLEREGAQQLVGERGLVVRAQNRDVRAVATSVLQDQNGTAVVVVLRNRSPRPFGRVPVAIDVRGRGGRSVYRNDAPGLDPSLVEATGVPASGELVWVNDQVTPAGKPKAASARVGAERGDAPRELPQIDLTRPRLIQDRVTGVEAVGRVKNRSDVEQRRLVVSCVARRGDKVVAAGRAIVPRLAPGKSASFHVFFIGDPRGARLTVAAPPTVIE
ncbi:MAG TPA: hypothetical protein VKB25_09585 [Conexibacter sp.]|nr:hypothetical protein [Conexibacter sp.]